MSRVRRNVDLKALAYGLLICAIICYSHIDPPIFIRITLAIYIIRKGTVLENFADKRTIVNN
jgi:hypothetical protein